MEFVPFVLTVLLDVNNSIRDNCRVIVIGNDNHVVYACRTNSKGQVTCSVPTGLCTFLVLNDLNDELRMVMFDVSPSKNSATVLIGVNGSAHTNPGNLMITVIDIGGRLRPGAVVGVVDPISRVPMNVTTGTDGIASFNILIGLYDILINNVLVETNVGVGSAPVYRTYQF